MERLQSLIRNNSVLLVILIIAASLRFWSLSVVPPSPSLDEVTIGYNAFSILKTGRDEYGTLLPLLLRAYDDWRPALYVYLVVPSVLVFGLNTFSVRFPSVLLSLGTIYASYRLSKLFFSEKVLLGQHSLSGQWISYSVAFLLAISPWHIYLSRLGHEVNLGLFLTVFALYLFLKGVLKKEKIVFCFSGIIFGLGFSSYQSEKVVLPILLISLIVLFWKGLWEIRRAVLLSGSLFLLFALPAIFVTLSPQGLTRFQGTSVFSSTENLTQTSAVSLLRAREANNLLGEIYFNRRFVPIRLLASGYLSHFNPEWLFFGGFRENHKVPNLGLLYLFEAPFLILGIFCLMFIKFNKRYKLLIIIWFLSSPIPASITTEAPHAMRSFTFLPSLQIIEALGIIYAFSLFRSKLSQMVSVGIALVVLSLSISQFLYGYFILFPKTQADSFQSALYQAMQYLTFDQTMYKKVIVSNQDNLYQSYMFYLFVSKYDPLLYQQMGGTGSGGYAVSHEIGNVSFRPITPKEQVIDHELLIGNKADFVGGLDIRKEFYYPDGKIGVVVSYD